MIHQFDICIFLLKSYNTAIGLEYAQLRVEEHKRIETYLNQLFEPASLRNVVRQPELFPIEEKAAITVTAAIIALHITSCHG
jgi:hypothetical protein